MTIQLINDDCLVAMKDIPEKSIDMILCDLPYGTTQNSWDSVIPFDKLWQQYERIIKPNGAIVLFACSPFDKVLAVSNLKMFKYEWIWNKNKATGHLNAKKMPLRNHENILVFYKSLPTYNPQMTDGHKPMNSVKPRLLPKPEQTRCYGHAHTAGNSDKTTKRYPKTVLTFPVINNDNPEKFHPTQKPVELCEYLIKTYTNEGDTVLDNCMGSGTTGVACKNTNRNFIGIELDTEYFNMAKDRIN